MSESIIDQWFKHRYHNTKNCTSELTGLKITNEDYDFESAMILTFGEKKALEIVNRSNHE